MTIVIPFCHKDADQALRMIAWIVKLGGLPKDVSVLLAASRRGELTPVGKRVIEAGRDLLNADLFVPHDEDERGWPHSATHLFQRTLAHVQDDFFWLEPDCVPIGAGWFGALWAEFKAAGKPFMGAYVKPKDPTVRDHLTGCSFYGRAWRELAPALGKTKKGKVTGAWDLDYADAILPHAAFTALIQHDWDRFNPAYKPGAADLRPGVRLFHQCKTGHLMNDIDPEFLKWRLTVPLLHPVVSNVISRHFLTENVSKQVRVDGKPVHFDPVFYFAPSSSFWGVREAADDNEAAVLSQLAEQGALKAISPEEYADYLVKKNGTSASLSSKSLSEPRQVSGPATIQTKAAALVEEAPAKLGPAVEIPEPAPAETLGEALQPQPLPAQKETLEPAKLARRKK